MNRNETAHEPSFNIIETMFHKLIARDRYYFHVHTFIGQQVIKRSLQDLNLFRHNHGHHGKADSSISDIVVMEKKDEIVVHDYIKTRWINHYPEDDTGDC